MIVKALGDFHNILSVYLSTDRMEMFYFINNRTEAIEQGTMLVICSSLEFLIHNCAHHIAKNTPSNTENISIIIDQVWNELYPNLIDLLATEVQQKTGVSTIVNHDALCRLNGERLLGGYPLVQNMVDLNMGYQIRLGLLLNNQYQKSLPGFNIGGVSYLDSIYEDYCSIGSFLRQYGLEYKNILQKASKKEKLSLALLSHYGTHLGELIKTLIFIYDPEVILISGPITKASEYFSASLHKTLRTFRYPHIIQRITIKEKSEEQNIHWGGALLTLQSS